MHSIPIKGLIFNSLALNRRLISHFVLSFLLLSSPESISSNIQSEPPHSGQTINKERHSDHLSYIELDYSERARTASQRAFLRYMSECALPADKVLFSNQDDGRIEFRGDLGLAPNWPNKAMNNQELHWVSACMLARTNYFSTPLAINLRANPAPNSAFKTNSIDAENFPLHEGGFFGNIFQQPSQRYVCMGSRLNNEETLLRKLKRVCAVSDQGKDQTTDRTNPLSACGFTLVGACSDPKVFRQGGKLYKEVIHVWLPYP